ncbi:helix-turn-helix domain-containing protein [Candidatus Hecatella orcuttiae]|jgi:DNA-binding transcriptional ArsR family regulator|uniref:helix-turn-helix domain-containing protein n=1 Tax=Candidatus Hecatella orcuttiae TaxID=1935119 RepID=UPI002867BAAC|nr:helix-turn-helix domain-containing protein [Candidatus Hecatella orcuttiae]
MQINDPAMKERVAKAVSDRHVREIVSATIARAKSASELSGELGIPVRSVYRYLEELSSLGLLTGERSVLMNSGGRYTLYRSMVKSVTVKYGGGSLEVDLVPNEDLLDRFMRFWRYMSR